MGKDKTNIKEEWFENQSKQGKYIAEQIVKHHDYFSSKDSRLKYQVQILKILVLVLALCSTIVLGLTGCIDENSQINIGLVLSAVITFVTAITSFLNSEKYWMRNISIHIELNKLRDLFVFEATRDVIDEERLEFYMDSLKNMQDSNIKYWKRAIKNL